MILQTLAGESVEAACHELGIERAQFQELRTRALAGALAALAPRPPGRPPKAAQASAEEVQQLRHEVDELRHELSIEHVRLELALAGLIQPPTAGSQEKGAAQRGSTA